MVLTLMQESSISMLLITSLSFSYSLFHHFPRVFKHPTTLKRTSSEFHKYICGNVSRMNFSTALSHAFDEFPLQQTDRNSEGIDFLHIMEARGIRANFQTYLWLLEGCFNSGSLLCSQKLHGKILKSGFDSENVLCDRIIDIYLACGDLDGAVKVFDEMRDRSVSSWNKIINGFVAKKLSGRVLGLLQRMIAENVIPDETTFAGVLRACGGGNVAFQYVQQIHARIIYYGFGANTRVCNPLIDLYSKNGFIDSAKKIFDRLYLKDSVSWVAIMSGLSQNGHEVESVFLFCQMHTSGITPTPYIFSSVLSACTKIELFEVGEQFHGLVFKGGFSSETYVCNALVTLYSRSGNFISAEQIFSTMQYRDEVSYNSLISGLAQRGSSDRALELFKKMQLDCLKPDCVTVASLLSACASVGALHVGRQLHSYAIKGGMSLDIILEGSLLDLYVKCSDIDTAHEFFLTTETKNVVLWNVMLVAYGQLGNLSDSFEIFRQMQIEGMIPNQFTYPSILRTCTSLGALDLGKQIHSQVIKTGFQLNEYVCSVLIDIAEKAKDAIIYSYTRYINGFVAMLDEKDAAEIASEVPVEIGAGMMDHLKLPKGKVVAVGVMDGWDEAKLDQYNCILVANSLTMNSLNKV
ncbi:pentatricopeptide repeat-containing protein At4g13650 [Fagus crenata]